MTIYHPYEIAGFWVNNGGNRASVVDAVSVAEAESGGNNFAISPSNDYGLWQINSINWASQGLTALNWFDPNKNAQVAIRMSGNGSNWAAWCTAWANPAGNCGHGWLPTPENGSAAADQEGRVIADLNAHGIPSGPPPVGPPNFPTFANYVNDFMGGYGIMQNYLAGGARNRWAIMHNATNAAERIRP